MTAPTPGTIIDLALRDAGVIGVGQTALAQDTNNALLRLNWMLDQWARQRWLIWHLVTLSLTSTGAQSYTVGPSTVTPTPDFVTPGPRPDRIESAFLRQLNTGTLTPDYPLEPIVSRETYNHIALKTLTSFPNAFFYDSAWDGSDPMQAVGYFYPWPVAQSAIYALFITIKDILVEFADLTTPINLPPEYFAALHTNLAVVLRDAYDLPPKVALVQRAKVALNVLRKANVQIPRLRMPAELIRPGIYNVFSDQVR